MLVCLFVCLFHHVFVFCVCARVVVVVVAVVVGVVGVVVVVVVVVVVSVVAAVELIVLNNNYCWPP